MQSTRQHCTSVVCPLYAQRLAHSSSLVTNACRQSEASAHLGAILTGYDLLAMFIVRKLGLSLGELDDVTSETKSVDQVKAEVTSFGSHAAGT